MGKPARPAKPPLNEVFKKALGAGRIQADHSDRQLIRNAEATATAKVPPATIQWRKRVRKCYLPKVIARALSIDTLTLLQSLAVVADADGMWLVDGGHRLMAMLLMDTPPQDRTALLERMSDNVHAVPDKQKAQIYQAISDLPHKAYPLVPVHQLDPKEMADVGGINPELLAQLAANIQRDPFTAVEIQEMAKQLVESGFTMSRGRRAKGGPEVSVQRMLQDATGKSAATIWRILSREDQAEGESAEPVKPKPPVIREAKLYSWLDAQEDRSALETLRDRVLARLEQLGR